MRKFMEAQQVDFVKTMMNILDVEKDEVAEIIERLDVDDISKLIAAALDNNESLVREIAGVEEVEDTTEEADKDELRGLVLRKGDAKKKHKKHKNIEEDDEDRSYSIGDEIVVDGEDATVKIPNAPGDTVGVMINGELKMIDKKKNVTESIIGMSGMPPINRMRQLAGLPDVAVDETLDDLDYNEPAPIVEPEDDIDMGVDMGMDAGEVDDLDLGFDFDPEPIATSPDLGGSSPFNAGGADTAFAADDAIDPVADPVADLGALDAAIADIEAMIPNCKLSDYKSLVARLEALVALAKSEGKAAVLEHQRQSFRNKLDEALDFDVKWSDLEDDFDALDREDEDALAADDFDLDLGEGKLHQKEDALDTDGDGKTDNDDTPRKTLMDYVKETEQSDMTLGNNANDAVKVLQARMGPKTTPQQARQAFDSMKKSQVIKQTGSTFSMPTMGDAELNLALDQSNKGETNKKDTMNKGTQFQNQSQGKTSNPNGGGNGYQGQ